MTSLVGGKAQWYGHFGEWIGSFSSYNPTISHQRFFSLLLGTDDHTSSCARMILAVMFRTAGKCKQPNCLSLEDGFSRMQDTMHWNTTRQQGVNDSWMQQHEPKKHVPNQRSQR